jgi:hypothetical protein
VRAAFQKEYAAAIVTSVSSVYPNVPPGQRGGDIVHKHIRFRTSSGTNECLSRLRTRRWLFRGTQHLPADERDRDHAGRVQVVEERAQRESVALRVHALGKQRLDLRLPG